VCSNGALVNIYQNIWQERVYLLFVQTLLSQQNGKLQISLIDQDLSF